MKRKIFCSVFLAGLFLSGCSSMPDMETGRQAYNNQDYETAYYHYEKLSEFGLPAAKLELGKMYLAGEGVPEDPRRAAKLFQEAHAASGGNARVAQYITQAQTRMGTLSVRGEPGSLPASEGVNLLKAAAEGGNPGALLELGYAYENGRGVSRDGQQADFYYQQAAEAGLSKATYYRAQLHDKGQAVPQDLGLARQLYQQAADEGYARGYLNLGRIYEKGIGVDRDYDKALEYYRLAEAHDISAQKDMQRLQKSLD